MIKWIRAWWQGKYIPPNNRQSQYFWFVEGHYEHHWTARLARSLAKFYLREWRWLIPVLVSVCGIIAALVVKFY
jgi:hypothetical protein